MTLLFFLKLLGEYAFYFILANYFARQSGGQGLPMALVFLPPAVVCLSSVLHTKKPALEKLPLLLLLPAFWLLSHRADQAVYLLACAYGCVLVFRHVYQHSYDTAVANFQRCAAILVLVYPLLCLVSGGRQALEQGVPLALLFLGVSILQMRMLRHDDQTLNDRRFLFQNLLALAGVTCLGLLASSQVFLGLLRTIGAFFYNTVVLTVIRLGLAVVLGVCWAASQLYGLFDHEYTPPSAQQIQLDLGGPLPDMEYAEITGAPHWVQYLVQGLLIALLVAAVAYILYKLAARRPQDHRQAAFTRPAGAAGTSPAPAPAGAFLPPGSPPCRAALLPEVPAGRSQAGRHHHAGMHHRGHRAPGPGLLRRPFAGTAAAQLLAGPLQPGPHPPQPCQGDQTII